MRKEQALEEIKGYVHKVFKGDAGGHDDLHMDRVARSAKAIAISEGEDPFFAEVAALLHDIGDHKLFENPEDMLRERDDLLVSLGLSDTEVQLIDEAIYTVSFSKKVVPRSKLGEIIQDADRLDAIGAVGIARTFAYGGTIQQPIYSRDGGGSINHFHEKLLKIQALMNTVTGKKEAERRHKFMVKYLEEFQRECGKEIRDVTK